MWLTTPGMEMLPFPLSSFLFPLSSFLFPLSSQKVQADSGVATHVDNCMGYHHCLF